MVGGSPAPSGWLADVFYWVIEAYLGIVETVFGLKEE